MRFRYAIRKRGARKHISLTAGRLTVCGLNYCRPVRSHVAQDRELCRRCEQILRRKGGH